MELEVGKTYVLNNGEKHVCEVGLDTGFEMAGYWYHDDGVCGHYNADSPLSVSHEYTQPKGKTLAELDVKAGDVVECVVDGSRADIIDCDGELRYCYEIGKGIPIDSAVEKYRIISRATDTPTLWRDMTDAEKGALLLAKHEGKPIEYMMVHGEWVVSDGLFFGHRAYRIKPTPKVETVTMYANKTLKGFGLVRGPKTTHRITFNTIDGKPDTASIRMEEM